MQNSWQQWYPSHIPPQMENFLLPLTPQILISEGSCSKNLATIGSPLVSFLASGLTQSLATPLLTSGGQVTFKK
jgi:hypothetical protein